MNLLVQERSHLPFHLFFGEGQACGHNGTMNSARTEEIHPLPKPLRVKPVKDIFLWPLHRFLCHNDPMPGREPSISVVILSYNRRTLLEENLSALRQEAQKISLEIVVAENASSDGTPRMLSERFPEIRVVPQKKNIGIAACNPAFSICRSDIIVILDDDSIPQPGTLAAIPAWFERNPRLGILALDVRHPAEPLDPPPHNPTQGSVSMPLMGFNGAGTAFRRQALLEAGGYEGRLFLYWNELDLTLRMLGNGWELQWAPDLKVIHHQAPSNRASRRAPYYYTRNLYWIIWRFFPLRQMLRHTFWLWYQTLYHSLGQRTTVYLEASLHALLRGAWVLEERQPSPELTEKIRLFREQAFTQYR